MHPPSKFPPRPADWREREAARRPLTWALHFGIQHADGLGATSMHDDRSGTCKVILQQRHLLSRRHLPPVLGGEVRFLGHGSVCQGSLVSEVGCMSQSWNAKFSGGSRLLLRMATSLTTGSLTHLQTSIALLAVLAAPDTCFEARRQVHMLSIDFSWLLVGDEVCSLSWLCRVSKHNFSVLLGMFSTYLTARATINEMA